MLLTTSVPCSARCFCSSVPTKWRCERCLRKPIDKCHRFPSKMPPSLELESSWPAHCTPLTGALCRAAIQPWAQTWVLGKRLPEKVSAMSSIIRSNEDLNFFILFTPLERESHAKLDLTTRCSSFRDRSKLWRINEAIRCAEIRVIECIEGLGPYLELHLFGDGKLTLQREIECLSAGTINCV